MAMVCQAINLTVLGWGLPSTQPSPLTQTMLILDLCKVREGLQTIICWLRASAAPGMLSHAAAIANNTLQLVISLFPSSAEQLLIVSAHHDSGAQVGQGGDVKMNAHAKVGSKAFGDMHASQQDREWDQCLEQTESKAVSAEARIDGNHSKAIHGALLHQFSRHLQCGKAAEV